MDQAPLPFILDDKRTYAATNSKDVIAKTGSSGWYKRQATVQLAVFGDGVSRVKPLLIFNGKDFGLQSRRTKSGINELPSGSSHQRGVTKLL